MKKLISTFTVIGMLTGLALVVELCGPNAANSQEKKPPKKPDAKLDLEQATFMRKKLEASNEILEGLVTEDSDLVIKGARALVELSTAEKWQVQHNAMYKQFSAEFQQSAKKLVDAAEKENFDAVALKWIDTTMKCVECHKFVRGARLAGGAR